MQVSFHPRFDREWKKIPVPIREWAAGWIKAAKSPDATLSSVLDGAEALKGGNFRSYYARKWRRKGHGEHRLVFKAEGEEVRFVNLAPREDDYKTAARRAREIPE